VGGHRDGLDPDAQLHAHGLADARHQLCGSAVGHLEEQAHLVELAVAEHLEYVTRAA
jgi:hypothetical protein